MNEYMNKNNATMEYENMIEVSNPVSKSSKPTLNEDLNDESVAWLLLLSTQ